MSPSRELFDLIFIWLRGVTVSTLDPESHMKPLAKTEGSALPEPVKENDDDTTHIGRCKYSSQTKSQDRNHAAIAQLAARRPIILRSRVRSSLAAFAAIRFEAQ